MEHDPADPLISCTGCGSAAIQLKFSGLTAPMSPVCFFFFLMFIFEREREGGTERERERIPSRLSAQSPMGSWNSQTMRSRPEQNSDP